MLTKNYSLGKKFILLFCIFLLLTGFTQAKISKKVKIIFENKTTFIAEVALSNKEKEIGLGFRKENNSNLLFWYNNPKERLFWMKNMNFSIDIIWIRDCEVVLIKQNVPPPSILQKKLPIYGRAVLADKVLEIPNGEVVKYKIKKGMKVKLVELNENFRD